MDELSDSLEDRVKYLGRGGGMRARGTASRQGSRTSPVRMALHTAQTESQTIKRISPNEGPGFTTLVASMTFDVCFKSSAFRK